MAVGINAWDAVIEGSLSKGAAHILKIFLCELTRISQMVGWSDVVATNAAHTALT